MGIDSRDRAVMFQSQPEDKFLEELSRGKNLGRR
jgi:hypothetical protein